MITLNTTTKLPNSFKLYAVTKIFLILALLASPVLFFGGIKPLLGIFITLAIFLGLPLVLYFLAIYATINFVVQENGMTVTSGLIIKRSRSVAFDRVQNVYIEAGPLARMFGITKVNMWTASVGQMQLNNGQSYNQPDLSIYLKQEDATKIKEMIEAK